MKNAGNVTLDDFGMYQGDVLLNLIVDTDPDMKILGKNVISSIDISLYEALKGTKKKVNTIKGEMTLMIRPGTKHKDQIKLSGYGVEGKGDHLFTINVNCPNNTDKLIEFLEKE